MHGAKQTSKWSPTRNPDKGGGEPVVPTPTRLVPTRTNKNGGTHHLNDPVYHQPTN